MVRVACLARSSFGKVIFDADLAEIEGKKGEKVILVREETKPEDIHGFFAAQRHIDQSRRQDFARSSGGSGHG